jgi:hypothetical protein
MTTALRFKELVWDIGTPLFLNRGTWKVYNRLMLVLTKAQHSWVKEEVA